MVQLHKYKYCKNSFLVLELPSEHEDLGCKTSGLVAACNLSQPKQ